MTVIKNDILIDAPIDQIWTALTEVDRLEEIDPAVKNSTPLSQATAGLGVERRVDMLDGKNWFEEKCTAYVKHEALTFELQACSFPVHSLRHSYSFQEMNGKTQVTQHMEYQLKYGILGQLLGLILRPMWNKGNRTFLQGLQDYTESKSVVHGI